jgi:hypothetical protein
MEILELRMENGKWKNRGMRNEEFHIPDKVVFCPLVRAGTYYYGKRRGRLSKGA